MSDWSVEIDFDRNGNFSGTYDDVTALIFNDPVTFFVGMRPFQRVADEPTATFTLQNLDRLFSPLYSGGPLYGKLVKNLPVKIENSTHGIQWFGVTKSFVPTSQRFANPVTRVTCGGSKITLDLQRAILELFKSMTVDEILAIVLKSYAVPGTATNWILDDPNLSVVGSTTILGSITDLLNASVGKTVINYAADNVQRRDTAMTIYQFIKDIIWHEQGQFWQGKDGVFQFRNRWDWLGTDTPDYTVDDTQDTATQSQNSSIINQVKIQYYPRTLSADNTADLFSLEKPIEIGANSSYVVDALYSLDGQLVGGDDVQAPIVDAGTVTNTDVYAQQSTITIENTGSDTITVTSVDIKGQSIQSSFPVVYTAQSDDKMSQFGITPLNLNLLSVDDPTRAEEITRFELEVQGTVVHIASVTLSSGEGGDADQITADVGDVVRVINYQLAIDENYTIVGIQQSLTPSSKYLTTTWTLQPIPKFWVVGVTGFSEIGDFALAY